jgi:hypothetical protein
LHDGIRLITTNPPANDHGERVVLVPEASGDDIAAPVASLREAIPQAAAQALVLVIVPSARDPLPQPLAPIAAITPTIILVIVPST